MDEGTKERLATITYEGPKAPEKLNPMRAAISAITKMRPHETKRAPLGVAIHTMHARIQMEAVIRSFDGSGPIMNERQMFCQLALAGPIVHVEKVLLTKVVHEQPASRRSQHDPSIITNKKRYFHIRAAGKLVWSLSRSRIVPWRRKLFIPIIVGTYLVRDFSQILFIRLVRVLRALLPQRLYEVLRRGYRRHRPI